MKPYIWTMLVLSVLTTGCLDNTKNGAISGSAPDVLVEEDTSSTTPKNDVDNDTSTTPECEVDEDCPFTIAYCSDDGTLHFTHDTPQCKDGKCGTGGPIMTQPCELPCDDKSPSCDKCDSSSEGELCFMPKGSKVDTGLCKNSECVSECVTDEECGYPLPNAPYCVDNDAMLLEARCLSGVCDIVPEFYKSCDVCWHSDKSFGCYALTCEDKSDNTQCLYHGTTPGICWLGDCLPPCVEGSGCIGYTESSCEDGISTQIDSMCKKGFCIPNTPIVTECSAGCSETGCLCDSDNDCNDDNLCTIDSCEEGLCTNTPKSTTPLCDGPDCNYVQLADFDCDGSGCTLGDYCSDGQCIAGSFGCVTNDPCITASCEYSDIYERDICFFGLNNPDATCLQSRKGQEEGGCMKSTCSVPFGFCNTDSDCENSAWGQYCTWSTQAEVQGFVGLCQECRQANDPIGLTEGACSEGEFCSWGITWAYDELAKSSYNRSYYWCKEAPQ